MKALFSTRWAQRPRAAAAFSLVELLVVIALMTTAALLAGPALNAVSKAGDITKSTYDLAGVVQNARAYAITNNTYVWVGLFEENADSAGNEGTGRVILSTVASRDGSSLAPSTGGTSYSLAPSQIIHIGKLVKLENTHLKTFPAGTGSGATFDTRPPIATTAAQFGDQTPTESIAQFQAFSGSTAYQFRKTIQFSPRGEACISGSTGDSLQYTMTPVVEIGLQPTRGTRVDTANPNVAAIQISGLLGNVKTYRR